MWQWFLWDVFQAKIIHTGEIVAIKKVYQDRKYKNREYTITKELSHPNIIKLLNAFYTTGEKKDEIYLNLVMNYVSDNLNRLIRNYTNEKETFPLFLMKLYTFQVARALNYIHSLKLAHRDIKPQNILIDPSTNRVYLCDFGSAKVLHDDGTNVLYICSRYYRAPELIMDIKKYTEIKGKPFLQGDTTNLQLVKIGEMLECPKEEDLIDIPNRKIIIEKMSDMRPQSFEKVFKGMPPELIN